MKKIISLLLVLAFTFCFAACAKTEPTGVEPKFVINLATLQGPTGMGMACLLNKADEDGLNYGLNYTVCAGPDEITGKIISGDFDIAALPTNTAAMLYNKSNGKITMLALNTGCVLYILEKGDSIKTVADLKGKTIYVSGQGSTPEYILDYILEENGLKVGEDVILDFTYTTHNDLVAFAATGGADVVLLPEPAVTALQAKNSDMRVALSLEKLWGSESAPMGCIVANTEFYKNHPDEVKDFLDNYEESIISVTDGTNLEKVAALMEEEGIVASSGVAMKAIPRSNIMFMTGNEMRNTIEKFYNVLLSTNPDSIGGKLPDEFFYYAG